MASYNEDFDVITEPQQQVEDEELEAKRELPERLKRKIMEMEGTEETLIMEKPLTKTDVDGDEKTKTYKRIKRDREGGLSVEVIDPRLKVWKLKIRGYYDMDKKKKTKKGESVMYLLAYKWNHVVKANGLKEGNNLQLWSFRSQQKLCLALVLH
ncbi:PREDICTED: B3 domain-containing protein At3g25182-like [Camelina sativa]|uniref:B3 domain-containing protein At3g25182-like n=1 Tax=Camelina sativa TaxID=90675 RepID=A0ABM0YY01_CAMSA|nr:PREDICTED: B3 domain-containing protein At3g25182-like [Camelina sativa]